VRIPSFYDAIGFPPRREFPEMRTVSQHAGHAAPALLRVHMGRRFRVLIADDNHDAANSMAMLLELSGYEVEVAYDGEAALQLAERWPPDAAILDIAMPGKNGYEVARAMRARLLHHVVLVAHSGHLTIRHGDMAVASQFDLCFTKGMEFTDLRDQLDKLLKGVPNAASSAAPLGKPENGSKGGPSTPARGS
jgi:CheY-like chemotaxis protein